jgi:glucose-1-phosphate adenylyltransferase
MDYAAMAEFHWEKKADITVGVQPVSREDAGRFGLCKRTEDHRITSFIEKPTDPAVLEDFISRSDPERPFLGSMGIYLFNIDVLIDLMTNTVHDDFGGEVIPNAIQSHTVCGFDFDGFWGDIGTIGSFYEANLALTQPVAPFGFHDPGKPIYTRARFLPPSSVVNSRLNHVFMADGCRIRGVEISNSVIGLRSIIAEGTKIRDSILMGADYYMTPNPSNTNHQPVGIGKNCDIERAIIDKNAWLGDEVTILPFAPGSDLDTESWCVRDGIVVIPKGRRIPPGTTIGPS